MITSLSVNTGGLGRFGNCLFTIASTIGIACKNGQPFGFPEWIIKDNELFGQPADKMADYFLYPLPGLPANISFQDIEYHWEYRDYRIPVGNWNIKSHLQDPRYFEDYIHLIRHYFRMKDEVAFMNDWNAIHYRAGDYIDDPEAYHPRCSIDYYSDAINKFPIDEKFVIFSDDIAEAIKIQETLLLLDCRRNIAVHPGFGYLKDFSLMKRCKSFITANSSFSLMAAILGEHPEKKIVCPYRWFGTQADGLKFEGYPKGAIIL